MMVRLPDEQGFEFILFRNFNFGDQNYMIILNVRNYDPETRTYLGMMKGNGEKALTKIVQEIKDDHTDWFTDQGKFSSPNITQEVENLFYRVSRSLFREN